MSKSNGLTQDHTILANERTFAGWIRTGIASVALAVGLRAVFGEIGPTWIAKAIASVFIITSAYIFWAAQASAYQTLQRFNENDAHAQPMRRMRLLVMVFASAAVGVGAVLWAL